MNAIPPRALTIAGSDSGGGAGIQADLRTFHCCGVHGMSAVTAITVQNSLGVTGVHELPPQLVADQIESVVTDIGAAAAKTGMLGTAGIIDAVVDVVARLDVGPLVVDPVCASQHGDPLIRADAVEALRDRLIPLADLVTPNVGEVRLLTGVEVRDRDGQREAAKAMTELGCRRVLVKGGHLPDDPDAVDVLYDGDTFRELSAPRIDAAHTHGTGDTLAAAIAAWLARGLDFDDALDAGKRYVTAAIADGFPLGAGAGPVGHFWRLAVDPA